MEQILLAYGIPRETVTAIMMLYKNTKVKVPWPNGDTNFFNIVAGVLKGDTLAPETNGKVHLSRKQRLIYRNDINMWLAKVWTAIDTLSVI